ncbi:MAG: hypothetical protein NZM44_00585 [Candidatus Calescibacterium sp.]|nr:hypothetical protein [Candidatus Calescibacterium sp.]
MKGFSIIEIIVSILILLTFVLAFFQLHILITNVSQQNYISSECLAISASKIETIIYNSNLLTLKKIGSNYPIYNLIDPKELNYNSAWNVYDSFKKHYLANQIPFYFYEHYKDFGISTRIRVYSVKNFYTVTVYCYHKSYSNRKYSITAIIKSNY